jgi:hypothetical protein
MADLAESENQPSPQGGSDLRAAGQGWLRLLRDGNPEQKALARTELGIIFERLGMPSLAIEAYLGNVLRRERDARPYVRLARLIGACGDVCLAQRILSMGRRIASLSQPATIQREPCPVCGDALDNSCQDCAPRERDTVVQRQFLHCCCPPGGLNLPLTFTGSTRLEDVERKRSYYQTRGWMFEEWNGDQKVATSRAQRLAGSASVWSATFALVLFTGVLAGASFGPMLAIVLGIAVTGAFREIPHMAGVLFLLIFVTVQCVFVVAWIRMRRETRL